MSQQSLPPEIMQMSVEERLALAQLIWDSIDEDAVPAELTSEQKAEIDRRLDDLATRDRE